MKLFFCPAVMEMRSICRAEPSCAEQQICMEIHHNRPRGMFKHDNVHIPMRTEKENIQEIIDNY